MTIFFQGANPSELTSERNAVVVPELLFYFFEAGGNVLRLVFLVVADAADEVVEVLVEDALDPALHLLQRVRRHDEIGPCA